MYKGTFTHSLDTKGRVTIPVKMREALGDDFVITRSLDNDCLWILDAAHWAEMEAKINALPVSLPESRRLRRYLLGSACDGEVDKQGRMLLPANLREIAGIDKDVIFTGVGDRIEIWDKESYEAESEDIDMGQVTATLAEHGFVF